MPTGAGIAADHPGAAADVRLVQLPTDDDLRRVYPRMRPPEMPDPLGRTAFHEAGHVVVAEHYGIRPLWARVNGPGDGAMDYERGEPGATTPKPDPQAALCAASIHHAGLAAELLYGGLEPDRVLYLRASATDTENATATLHPHFGHSSGAHWYAQRLALCALSMSWPRVQEIAAHLIEFGIWRPDV